MNILKSKAKEDVDRSLTSLKDLLANSKLDGFTDIAEIREKFNSSFSDLENSTQSLLRQTKRKSRKAAKATNKMVHTDPWPVVGAALILGAILGALSLRR